MMKHIIQEEKFNFRVLSLADGKGRGGGEREKLTRYRQSVTDLSWRRQHEIRKWLIVNRGFNQINTHCNTRLYTYCNIVLTQHNIIKNIEDGSSGFERWVLHYHFHSALCTQQYSKKLTGDFLYLFYTFQVLTIKENTFITHKYFLVILLFEFSTESES